MNMFVVVRLRAANSRPYGDIAANNNLSYKKGSLPVAEGSFLGYYYSLQYAAAV